MPPKIGYLLPTRERVMEGRPQAGPLLDLAARAEGLGFDSVWVGDSLLARPRHDPLTLLAAVAARTWKVQLGTAVFLPALRNPVVLAHQLATLDQISEGRLVLGAGHRQRRREHPDGIHRCRRAVRRPGRPHDGALAACPGIVEREADRLGRAVAGRGRRARPYTIDRTARRSGSPDRSAQPSIGRPGISMAGSLMRQASQGGPSNGAR